MRIISHAAGVLPQGRHGKPVRPARDKSGAAPATVGEVSSVESHCVNTIRGKATGHGREPPRPLASPETGHGMSVDVAAGDIRIAASLPASAHRLMVLRPLRVGLREVFEMLRVLSVMTALLAATTS